MRTKTGRHQAADVAFGSDNNGGALIPVGTISQRMGAVIYDRM
jgi:hypothetical protein